MKKEKEKRKLFLLHVVLKLLCHVTKLTKRKKRIAYIDTHINTKGKTYIVSH